MKSLFALTISAALLAGCASQGTSATGVAPPPAMQYAPQNVGDSLVVAIAIYEQIGDTTKLLLNAKKISSKDAENIVTQANSARQALDVAIALRATNPLAAKDKLAATTTILQALQAYLTLQQGK